MAYKSLRWQQVAKRSKSLRHQGVELLSSVAHSMRAMVELLLGRRPARS